MEHEVGDDDLIDHSNVFEEATMAAKLAVVINDSCHELEHLDICHINAAFFELFVPTVKFTCLVPFSYDRLQLLYEKQGPTGLLPMKLVCFEVHEVNSITWDNISEVTVEHLLAMKRDAKYNELINLKSLDMDCSVSEHIGHLVQLEHITLRASWPQQLSKNTLRRIFDNNRKLVSLRLY